MSRHEGFDVMDVSTSLPNDPKIRRLAREAPEQLGPGFLVYVATMAESWKAGERVSVEDAWPSYMAFDDATVAALRTVKLLDERGRVLPKAWRGWFEVARERREKSRDRWRRANAAREQKLPGSNGNDSADTAMQPRGNSADTASQSESVSQSESSTTPPTPSPARGRRSKRPNGAPRELPPTDYDALMVTDDPETGETVPWLQESKR